MTETHKCLPPSVIRRLTKYLTHIQVLQTQGVEWVSSQELATNLGLTSSTVRQDLSHVDFSGISRRGYEIGGLCAVLSKVLGADTVWNMIVVGGGNLGRALALHEEFSRRGFNICAIFDNDEKKVGKKIGRLTVQHTHALPSVIRTSKIDVAVIAVPAAAAQGVTDILIASRVRGILNMAQTHIVTPHRVPVVDVRIVASLQELAHAINRRQKS